MTTPASTPLSVEIPSWVLEIITRLQKSTYQAYVVGGAVRDALAGRNIKEWDVCTSARPEQVQELFSKVIPTGLAHGTVTVVPERGTPVEVTTLRLEGGYSDGRHPDSVQYTQDLNADLSRRDFTVNAMAYDPTAQILYDPFDGQIDLKQRMLKTVGSAVQRFSEDGLRPMRAVRFAAQLDFALSNEILEAIPETLEITRKVAVERLRDEFMKLLAAPKPSTGLRLMQRTGLMALVVPELLEGVGIEQNEYHAYDVFEHSLHACDACTGPALLRLAVLFHDIAKPRTRAFLKGAYRFYGHDNVGAKMVEAIMKRLKFSNNDRAHVVNLVEHHMFYYRDEWTDAAVRRFLKKIGPPAVEDLLALRVADELGSGVNAPDYARLDKLRARMTEIQNKAQALSTKQLAVDGKDVMQVLNLKPGPEIGKVLAGLLERVLDDPSLNERETLLKIIAEKTLP